MLKWLTSKFKKKTTIKILFHKLLSFFYVFSLFYLYFRTTQKNTSHLPVLGTLVEDYLCLTCVGNQGNSRHIFYLVKSNSAIKAVSLRVWHYTVFHLIGSFFFSRKSVNLLDKSIYPRRYKYLIFLMVFLRDGTAERDVGSKCMGMLIHTCSIILETPTDTFSWLDKCTSLTFNGRRQWV